MARPKNPRGGTARTVRVSGTVALVIVDKGICFITPDEGAHAGLALEPGKDIFMHKSANDGKLPAKGDTGEFDVGAGDQGPRVVRVVRWTSHAPSAHAPVARSSGAVETFIHPYNFVPVPVDGLVGAANVHPFSRAPSAPHDRYETERCSGWLDCRLESKTWWFIPDARKQVVEGEHKLLGYFTLDPVDRRDKERPEVDVTRPAISASSLRGMVRSVFEAATLSCFSVFDSGVLDLRVGFEPGSQPRGTRTPEGRQQPKYVPVRVSGLDSSGGVSLQVLDGWYKGDLGNTLPVALVHAYTPRVAQRNGSNGAETGLWRNLVSLVDGTPVAALVDQGGKPRTKRRGNGSTFIAFHYREASKVAPADQASTLHPAQEQILVFGYLHRTGPNIENKHHERIFFRWADY